MNKKGEITPPYFMLLFQQGCLSAFENDVLAWEGACSFRGKLISVVQRNKDWTVQKFVWLPGPHFPPHPWSVGAFFG